MVPTTRSLPPHHDYSGKNTKPSYYDPAYYIAAQLEAAHGGDPKQQLSRFPRRITMADDDSAVGRRRRRRQGEEEAAGTSSGGGGGGDGEEAAGDKDWLRLGLGAMASSSSTTSSSSAAGDNDGVTAQAPPAALDLFVGGKQSASMMNRPPLFPLPIRSYHCQYGHDRYRPTTTAASGSMNPAPPFLPFARPLRSCSADLLMRVVSPPPPTTTEAAGLWLTLQASTNQVREPILPQIPKSYLRIRDCNMKVEVVLKYLADKLGFTQYHQVELTCRGHFLPPFMPVKHVRDSIWRGSPAPGQEEAPEPPPRRSPPAEAATATDHVMTLLYSTSRNHH